MKKRILILMLVTLSMILSACSPTEPPAESPIESSTPIETPAETPAPYDFSKIRFVTQGVMDRNGIKITHNVFDMGEINSIDEYNTKTAELLSACKSYDVQNEHGVTFVSAFIIKTVFKPGCDMTDDELKWTGLGSRFERTQNDDHLNEVNFDVFLGVAWKGTFDSALKLSQNEKVECIYIQILYACEFPT